MKNFVAFITVSFNESVSSTSEYAMNSVHMKNRDEMEKNENNIIQWMNSVCRSETERYLRLNIWWNDTFESLVPNMVHFISFKLNRYQLDFTINGNEQPMCTVTKCSLHINSKYPFRICAYQFKFHHCLRDVFSVISWSCIRFQSFLLHSKYCSETKLLQQWFCIY